MLLHLFSLRVHSPIARTREIFRGSRPDHVRFIHHARTSHGIIKLDGVATELFYGKCRDLPTFCYPRDTRRNIKESEFYYSLRVYFVLFAFVDLANFFIFVFAFIKPEDYIHIFIARV